MDPVKGLSDTTGAAVDEVNPPAEAPATQQPGSGSDAPPPTPVSVPDAPAAPTDAPSTPAPVPGDTGGMPTPPVAPDSEAPAPTGDGTGAPAA